MKIPRRIRFLYQKLTRGFSDKETWNLDYEIAKFALPRVKRFREFTLNEDCVAGHPGRISYDEWIEILDTIIYALDCTTKEYDMLLATDDCVDPDKWQEGLDLFGKWFRDLWW